MTRKRTFSLPDDLSQRLDQVASGNASAFVAESIAARLDRDDFLARLDQLWGPVEDPAALAWARQALGLPGDSSARTADQAHMADQARAAEQVGHPAL